MIYIGIDLGYKYATTVVVVRPLSLNKRFTFHSIHAATEFDDVVDKIATMMVELEVPLENVSCPGFPALKKELSKRFNK